MGEPLKHESRARREQVPKAIIDGWSVVEILLEHWHWVVVCGFVLAFLGWTAGMLAWKKTYMATAQLLRYEPMASGDFFKPQQLSQDTFASILKSPELLEQVGSNMVPPLSAEILNKCVLIKSDSDSDVVKVCVKAYGAQFAVNLANLYAKTSVEYFKDLQKRDAEAINRAYIQDRVAQMDTNISALEKQFRSLPQSTLLSAKLFALGSTVTNINQQLQNPATSYLVSTRLTEKLTAALDELNTLERKYTDEHPAVVQQKAEVAAIQKELAHATNSSAAGAPHDQLFNPEYEIIHNKLAALTASRQLLADRQQEAKAFIEDPPGNVRFFAPATMQNITPDHRWMKVGILTVFGGVCGVLFALGGIFLVEFLDTRLKSSSDVQRVTNLPVIATLEDLEDKSPSTRERWAFRTWTMLQGRLSPSPNHGLVCGITSSQAGEGRSTWINLLADAASLSGFRVLTIATRPANGEGSAPFELPNGHNGHNGENHEPTNAVALSTNALLCPSEVTQQLTGPNARPCVHIPLPGWVWNLERRKQWLDALEHWRKVENLVILVELPPASVPEAVLLGENLPNIVWLTSSGQADAAETRTQLETLRHAKCNLVGAVLNRLPAQPLKNRFPRWLGCFALVLLAFGMLGTAQAQEATLPSAPAYELQNTNTNNLSFSVTEPNQGGNWLRHLTLGPGDVLNISLYGQADLTEPNVLIAPDGTLSYLEAQNVKAAGLTVDELRTNLDQELAKYRRAPRTIISPVTYQSKKYYMLGRIAQSGVYVLDHPTTVLEAVARAHGLQSAVSGRNTVELADFQRCFLMRHGQRIPLDFENLFERGDFSQNIPIEPGDYLYFPSAAVSEVYVLGEVRLPGPVPYTENLTVMGALAARAGFTDAAYKSHVMVLRGSFNHPKVYVVDALAVLDARQKSFKLEPKDIIYVSGRPFLRGEQLADMAITAFLQSVTAEYTGKLMGMPGF